jgi:hypothetical protein
VIDAQQQRPISVRSYAVGRRARNRLAAQVFEDILHHWCEPAAPGSKLCKGAEALETLYKEKPGEYLRLTASVLPREFIFENVTLDLDDEQIDELLLALRRRMIEARAAPALLASPDADVVMSLNLDIDSLPPEKVEAAIARLGAVKAQRAAENKLAHYHSSVQLAPPRLRAISTAVLTASSRSSV